MIVLLHGFWGQPADWNPVLQRLPLGAHVVTPDLYEPGILAPHVPLGEWPAHFWRWVEETQCATDSPIQLVGYSMGARLAVNAASWRPERVSRALFLSGNPLPPPPGREMWEDGWSRDFLNKDWLELEKTWQEQAVFTGAPALQRRKDTPMREALGLSLRQWSPRLNPFSVHQLAALPATMDWAFGALDQKYLEVAKTLQELPVKGQISIIPGARHRLITEAADYVCHWLQQGN